MRVVIDTNIAFSAILNSNGRFAQILLRSKSGINFYSTEYLLFEINEHYEKLYRKRDKFPHLPYWAKAHINLFISIPRPKGRGY
ncbi:MAG: hypothetical protein K9H64_07695 [Bacteroidales bacterium]|nr:hypothetical protein [Bacteroidales bacterium]MCF8455677.1 hypothetical protein [Bacteroidales bacterium]